MRDIYFATYKLGSKNNPSPPIEQVVPLLEDWLFDSRHMVKKPKAYESLSRKQKFSFAEGREFATRFHESDGHRAYALKFRHPDNQIENKFWSTEIVISERDEEIRRTRASINVSIGYEGAVITRDVDVVSRPRLVKSLIEQFGAYESLPLSLEPRKLEASQVATFVNLLKHGDRTLPVVWISLSNATERPLVNPLDVADWLAGVAHVIVSDGVESSRRMDEAFPERFNCFNGAIRIYWAELSVEDSKFDHRLWLPHQVEQIHERYRNGFPEHILAYIAVASTNRHIDEIARWDDARHFQARSELSRLRAEGENKEALKVAEQIIDKLESDERKLEAQIEKLEQEKERARNEAKQWREAYHNERKGTDELEEYQRGVRAATLSEAVERALAEYGPESPGETTMRVPESVRNSIVDEFQDPESAFSALKWIGTTFVSAKKGQVECPDLDHSCRQASGFQYTPHQSKVTMGKFADDYYIQWKGEKRAFQRHLGKGNSKDPRDTLRLAFFFDDEDEVAVIGFIGQHQRTTAT